MFIDRNQLSVLRAQFIKELTKIYPEREAENIFVMLCHDKWGWGRLESLRSNVRITESEILYFRSAEKRLKKFMPVQIEPKSW